MIDRSSARFALGLLASTALATPAFAQNTQPQTTGQSPAPGTNATDVTAPPPPVEQAQDGQRPRPDRDHHHRDEARGESAECADQRSGDRHAQARPAEHLELRTIYQAAAVGQLPDSRAGLHPVYMRGVATRRRRQPLRLAAVGRHLSRRAAGHHDRRHARRPHLRYRPDRESRRAAGHALRRVERSGHDPHHHQQAGTWRHHGRVDGELNMVATAASAASSKA